jgi:hypothetical protein
VKVWVELIQTVCQAGPCCPAIGTSILQSSVNNERVKRGRRGGLVKICELVQIGLDCCA